MDCDKVTGFEARRSVEAGIDQPPGQALTCSATVADGNPRRRQCRTSCIQRHPNRRLYQLARLIQQSGELHRGNTKGDLQLGRIHQIRQLFIGRNQPSLNQIHRLQGSIKSRGDGGVIQSALRIL